MSSEASYIEDLKALVSTYRLLMDLLPGVSTVNVHQCILGILELHERLLDELRELGIGPMLGKPGQLRQKLSMRLVRHPRSEDPQANHRRSKSTDDAILGSARHVDQCDTCRSISEPDEAAYVAKIFLETVSRWALKYVLWANPLEAEQLLRI
jgi:hypothetical protein